MPQMCYTVSLRENEELGGPQHPVFYPDKDIFLRKMFKKPLYINHR